MQVNTISGSISSQQNNHQPNVPQIARNDLTVPSRNINKSSTITITHHSFQTIKNTNNNSNSNNKLDLTLTQGLELIFNELNHMLDTADVDIPISHQISETFTESSVVSSAIFGIIHSLTTLPRWHTSSHNYCLLVYQHQDNQIYLKNNSAEHTIELKVQYSKEYLMLINLGANPRTIISKLEMLLDRHVSREMIWIFIKDQQAVNYKNIEKLLTQNNKLCANTIGGINFYVLYTVDIMRFCTQKIAFSNNTNIKGVYPFDIAKLYVAVANNFEDLRTTLFKVIYLDIPKNKDKFKVICFDTPENKAQISKLRNILLQNISEYYKKVLMLYEMLENDCIDNPQMIIKLIETTKSIGELYKKSACNFVHESERRNTTICANIDDIIFQFSMAIEQFEHAIKLFEKIEDDGNKTKDIADCQNIINECEIHKTCWNIKQLYAQRKFMEIVLKEQKMTPILKNLNNTRDNILLKKEVYEIMANAYYELALKENTPKEKKELYCKQSISLYVNSGHGNKAAEIYVLMAEFCSEQNKITYYKKAIDLYEDAGNYRSAACVYITFAKHIDLEKNNKIKCYIQAIFLFEQAKDFYNAAHTCEILVNYYKMDKDAVLKFESILVKSKIFYTNYIKGKLAVNTKLYTTSLQLNDSVGSFNIQIIIANLFIELANKYLQYREICPEIITNDEINLYLEYAAQSYNKAANISLGYYTYKLKFKHALDGLDNVRKMYHTIAGDPKININKKTIHLTLTMAKLYHANCQKYLGTVRDANSLNETEHTHQLVANSEGLYNEVLNLLSSTTNEDNELKYLVFEIESKLKELNDLKQHNSLNYSVQDIHAVHAEGE